jgi:hypothetical protein
VNIACCHTALHPACAAALPPGTIRPDVSGDPLAYWRALRSLWTGDAGLLVIEHDIEIHAGVLPQLAECGEDWCTFPYLQQPGLNFTCTMALGCTRFSAALQRQVPFPPATRWDALDGAIANTLLAAGITAHVHQPPVTHHRA